MCKSDVYGESGKKVLPPREALLFLASRPPAPRARHGDRALGLGVEAEGDVVVELE